MRPNRNRITLVLLFLSFQVFSQNQQPIATILKSPADWGFERMEFPLGFAPGIKFTGFEEIRFAPGMMDTSSVNYFTYVFVVAIEGQKNLQVTDIKDFLDKYFKGLCISVGAEKKLVPDTSKIVAEVKRIPEASSISPPLYSASVPYFDTFSNGRKISLNMEIEVNLRSDLNKTYLTVLVSASKEKTIWDKLFEIRKSIVYN